MKQMTSWEVNKYNGF